MENIEQGWEGAAIIHAYSRSQALEDGVLVDLSDLAKEAGFRHPVAVTQGVWEILDPTTELEGAGQDMTGRAWDMLNVLRHAIRSGTRTDEVYFAPLFLMEPAKAARPVEMRAKCGPGDDAKPVITIMLRGED